MVPLVDSHVHLLAGLDDGPRDPDEAVRMGRMLVEQGVRHASALAHQKSDYPENDAVRLRAAAGELSLRLRDRSIPLAVYPVGEVQLAPDLIENWHAGRLMSAGDHRKFLLVEMPHGEFVDVRPFARELGREGVRIIIAHAERYPELIQERGLIEEIIAAGCLIQVTADRIASPKSTEERKVLADWAGRRMIHLLGSDGHRMGGGREPRIRAGYEALVRMTDRETADRIGGIWGAAILQGLPVRTPSPKVRRRSWLKRIF